MAQRGKKKIAADSPEELRFVALVRAGAKDGTLCQEFDLSPRSVSTYRRLLAPKIEVSAR